MLFDANLPREMLGEALHTAAYLHNRSLSSTVPKLSIRIWSSKLPDLSNVKIFGTVAFARKTTPLKKLDRRLNTKPLFVGYAPNGYRLWDPKTRKIFLAKGVIFTNRPETASSLTSNPHPYLPEENSNRTEEPANQDEHDQHEPPIEPQVEMDENPEDPPMNINEN